MRPRHNVGNAGFTLLELLVAVAIFAVVGTLALSGYTQLQKQSEYAEQRLERTREVQRAVQTLAQDLEQAEPRPVREPLGESQLPAVFAGDFDRLQAAVDARRVEQHGGARASVAAARRISPRPGWPVARSLARARSHARDRTNAPQAAGRSPRRDLPVHGRESKLGRALAGSRRRDRRPTGVRGPRQSR